MGLIYYLLLKCSWAWSKSHWSERELSVDFNGLCIRPRVSEWQHTKFQGMLSVQCKCQKNHPYFRNDWKSSHTASQPGHLHTPCPYSGWLCECSSWDRLEGGKRREEKNAVNWRYHNNSSPQRLLKSNKHQILNNPQHLTVPAWFLPMVLQNRIKYHLHCETCVILT